MIDRAWKPGQDDGAYSSVSDRCEAGIGSWRRRMLSAVGTVIDHARGRLVHLHFAVKHSTRHVLQRRMPQYRKETEKPDRERG